MMLTPPIEHMLASPLGTQVPDDSQDVAFEPKWDGFRCLAFRGHDTVVLQGRGRSGSAPFVDLAYAFPEVVAALLEQLPEDTVIDAEIVVAQRGRLDFGALGSRLRPRSEADGTNIERLARELPASILAFDVLWSEGDTMALPYRERRALLEQLATQWRPPLHLTPMTTDVTVARRWFEEFESAGVDGLIVKPINDAYQPGRRSQGKIKHQRTADVVVAGWRPHTRPGSDGEPVVGSLLLGLHDDAGVLQYVGVASAFTAKVRAELVTLLAPLALPDDAPHPWRGETRGRVPGLANRWKKEQPWIALRPELVAEVSYDQMEDDRFRHVAGFLRWRPDRDGASCTYEQLEVPPVSRIDDLLG